MKKGAGTAKYQSGGWCPFCLSKGGVRNEKTNCSTDNNPVYLVGGGNNGWLPAAA